ncbi:MAG: hypothetical protein O2955_00730 [Planctomycetota bacterium]|nr:hypothetical protein [Planctomycetota bacterium]MDA1211006.1 hypothetical protein [Planctomycetota bacterium]
MQTNNTYRNAANSQADIRFDLNAVATGHGCCTPSAQMHLPSAQMQPRSVVAVRQVPVSASKPALLKPEWLEVTPVEPPARAWAALVIGQALSS